MKQKTLNYARPHEPIKRELSPGAKWALIVTAIVIVAMIAWVALLAVEWLSHGPMGP